jgi:hypothetical protein
MLNLQDFQPPDPRPEPFMSRFWWLLLYVAIAIFGLILCYALYRYYKGQDDRRAKLLDPDEPEIMVKQADTEVNLTRRWMVMTLQIMVFSAVPILFVLKTGIAYDYHQANRSQWLGATILYALIVDGGGMGTWFMFALRLTMDNNAFESITKMASGQVLWHQWFYHNETPLTRGQVRVVDKEGKPLMLENKRLLVNDTLFNALKTVKDDHKDSTEFVINGESFWLTMVLTVAFDWDAVIIATRHPWEKAWIRQKKSIYARSIPLPADLSMCKFRHFGYVTCVLPRKDTDKEFELQMVPILFTESDDRDDVDAFQKFQIAMSGFGSNEFILANVAAVTPSIHDLYQKHQHLTVETDRRINAAELREKTRNQSNDAMAKLAGVGKQIQKSVRNDYVLIVVIGLVCLLFGTFVLSRLLGPNPYMPNNGENPITTITEIVEAYL